MKPPSLSKFARRLRREWRVLDLPSGHQKIVLAVSGGADSAALLTAVAELKSAGKLDLEFIAAHFNHCLRGAESDGDAEFVEKLAARFEFEFVSEKWERNSQAGSRKENLEQAARKARYQFLFETAGKHRAIAVLTAHTLNDQAETFLLRLIRGSGTDGLGAMRQMRILDSENQSEIRNPKSEILLVRPFLNWTLREMTEEYCRMREIDFRVDSMNKDENFDRVRVRRELLPLLKTFNPKIIEQLAQTAKLIGEDAEELNLSAEELLEKALKSGELEAKVLQKVAGSRRRRAIRMWIIMRCGSLKRLEANHFTAVDNLLMRGEGNSFVELPGGGVVTKMKGLLVYHSGEG